MKSRILLCGLLFISIGLINAQIVTDGSFEDPDNFETNWDPWIGPDAVDAVLEIVEDATAHSGDHVLRMVGSAADGDDAWVGPAQVLTLEPYTDYVLTMFIKGDNPFWSNNSAWANGYVGIFDEAADRDMGYDDMNAAAQCQDHGPGELVFGCGDMTDWLEITYYFGTLESTEVELWFGVWIDINPEIFVDDVSVVTLSGVESKGGSLPEGYMLNQNYPNPFNPSTTIHFSLPKSDSVRLTLFDVSGKQHRTLLNERLAAGSHSVQWNGLDQSGNDVPAGLYFYRLETDGFSETKKMLLVK